MRSVRATRKPGFLVIDTMRLGPHSKGDDLRDEVEMDPGFGAELAAILLEHRFRGRT